MKRQPKQTKHHYTLGDLIFAVSSSCRNKREAVAAVADLLESGKVRETQHHKRYHVVF